VGSRIGKDDNGFRLEVTGAEEPRVAIYFWSREI
jgi:hypothetical protein